MAPPPPNNNNNINNNNNAGVVNALQAWAILKRHAHEEIGPLRLQELCRDADRVSSLVAVHNSQYPSMDQNNNNNNRMLVVDLSRQRMTSQTWNHLLQLATARRVSHFVQHLSWGGDPQQRRQRQRPRQPPNDNDKNNTKNQHHHPKGTTTTNTTTQRSPPQHERYHRMTQTTTDQPKTTRFQGESTTTTTTDPIRSSSSSMHMALRVPDQQGYEMLAEDGSNVLEDIHYEWNRLERLVNLIRQGSFRGMQGHFIHTCLVVGSGTAVQALQFIYQALLQDEQAVRASQAGLVDGEPTHHPSGGTTTTTSAAMPSTTSSTPLASSSTNPTTTAAAANRLLSRPRNMLMTAAAAATGGGGGNPTLSSSSFSWRPHRSPPPPQDQRCRRLVFLSSSPLDAVAAAQTLESLHAGSTLVVSIALGGSKTEESSLLTLLVKQWLLQELGGNDKDTTAASSSSSSSTQAQSAPPLSHAQRILSKHLMLVTANDTLTSPKPESVHLIPPPGRAEAFTTCTAATLLPLGLVFGWSTCRDLLAGAHNVDCHLIETRNPRHNLPILLALTDVWNAILLGTAGGRVVTPFSQALAGYPAYCAALEAQVCGTTTTTTTTTATTTTNHPGTPSHLLDTSVGTSPFYGGMDPTTTRSSSLPSSGSFQQGGGGGCWSMVVDGGIAASCHDRALYQSPQIMNSELVMVLDPQLEFNAFRRLQSNHKNKKHNSNNNNTNDDDDLHQSPLAQTIQATQDALICSMFAHADELAFGSLAPTDSGWASTATTTGDAVDINPEDAARMSSSSSRGNRPSSLLLCSKLDAFSCGQLIALAEHRVAIKAHIWGQLVWHRELGSSLRTARTLQLQEGLTNMVHAMASSSPENEEDEDDDDDNNLPGVVLSTKTILRHYGRLIKDTRGTTRSPQES